jgi:hypothetical protein
VSKIPAPTLGLAAEYSVAAELCRRGIYAQLTLGNMKRTDLLVVSEVGGFTRIEVKAKQGRQWPNCKGISGRRRFLIFVDFQSKRTGDRPDFYILSSTDWRRVLERRVRKLRRTKPATKVRMTRDNVAVFPQQITKSGISYRGIGIHATELTEFHECWSKITRSVEAVRAV